jgi:hypothetical protein
MLFIGLYLRRKEYMNNFLYNKELHDMYKLSNTVSSVKSRRLGM